MGIREARLTSLLPKRFGLLMLCVFAACLGLVHFDEQLSQWHQDQRQDAVVYRIETGIFSRMQRRVSSREQGVSRSAARCSRPG